MAHPGSQPCTAPTGPGVRGGAWLSRTRTGTLRLVPSYPSRQRVQIKAADTPPPTSSCRGLFTGTELLKRLWLGLVGTFNLGEVTALSVLGHLAHGRSFCPLYWALARAHVTPAKSPASPHGAGDTRPPCCTDGQCPAARRGPGSRVTAKRRVPAAPPTVWPGRGLAARLAGVQHGREPHEPPPRPARPPWGPRPRSALLTACSAPPSSLTQGPPPPGSFPTLPGRHQRCHCARGIWPAALCMFVCRARPRRSVNPGQRSGKPDWATHSKCPGEPGLGTPRAQVADAESDHDLCVRPHGACRVGQGDPLSPRQRPQECRHRAGQQCPSEPQAECSRVIFFQIFKNGSKIHTLTVTILKRTIPKD